MIIGIKITKVTTIQRKETIREVFSNKKEIKNAATAKVIPNP